MNKPFKNIDFKVGAGLSLRWIMCDKLNDMFFEIKDLSDFVLFEDSFNLRSIRMCISKWLNFLCVLDFLYSIKVLDEDVFLNVTKDINNYINLLNESM